MDFETILPALCYGSFRISYATRLNHKFSQEMHMACLTAFSPISTAHSLSQARNCFPEAAGSIGAGNDKTYPYVLGRYQCA